MVNHMMKRQLGLQPKPRKTPEPTVRVRNRTGRVQNWGIYSLPADASIWTAVPKSLANSLAKEPKNYQVWDSAMTPIFEAQSREECKPWEMVKRPKALNALVSIVILGHNQFEYTEKCFNTIYQHTKCRFEIVFVDNGSSDRTTQIPTLFPQVRYFRSETNLGVAGGRNLGLKQTRGDIICILDNDIEAIPQWDTRLLTALDSAPDVGMVGTFGCIPNGLDFTHVPRDRVRNCQTTVGQTQMFWADIIPQVGLIDENMVWHEDSEFSHRIFKAGYQLLCVPIDMPHKGNVTTAVVRATDFRDRWDSDAVYMQRKLADDNTVYIHRTIDWPSSHNSLSDIASSTAKALRDFGYTVFQRATLKHDYPLLQNATAFTMVFRGKTFGAYHAENSVMPKRYIEGMPVDINLCVSEHVSKVLLASGMDQKRLRICHLNAIDTSVFNISRQPRGKKPFRFLWVGSSQPRKGLDVLLNAFEIAFDRDDNVELVIKDGGYGQRRETEQMISENPLRRKIRYLWQAMTQEELADLYRSASFDCGAFVHPHRAEGFGKTPLEAAICGCRVGMTGWSATNEFFDARTMTKFPFRLTQSRFHNHPAEPYYDSDDEQPEWAQPNATAIAGWMRKVMNESVNGNVIKNVSRMLSQKYGAESVAREVVDTVNQAVLGPMRDRKSDDRGWDYWHVGEGFKRFTDPAAIEFAQEQADLLIDLFDLNHRRSPRGTPNAVLHVGAAQGHVVRALMNQGIQAYGLEAGKQGRIQARFAARNTMITGDMADPPNLHRDYDLIYVTDAMEHIEPELVRTAMKNIFGALRVGGIAVIIPETLENPRLHLDPTHKTLREFDWWAREFATIFHVMDDTDWQSIFDAQIPEMKKMHWIPLVGRKGYYDE